MSKAKDLPFSNYETLRSHTCPGGRHRVRLEKIELAQSDTDYPRCVAGARACPPEDVGGPWGYEGFILAINNPDHDNHDRMLEWIGGSFDPDYFDPEEVWFDDPKQRLEIAFGDDSAA